jgi:hypothetical protein
MRAIICSCVNVQPYLDITLMYFFVNLWLVGDNTLVEEGAEYLNRESKYQAGE